MIEEGFKLTGKLTICRFNSLGILVEERRIKNLVVNTGKEWIAARMVGTSAVMSHMAVGTNSYAAAAGDNGLGTETARVALNAANAVGATAVYIASFPAGIGTGALSEAGILNAGVGGTMVARTVFPVVNKGASDAMSITWEITAS